MTTFASAPRTASPSGVAARRFTARANPTSAGASLFHARACVSRSRRAVVSGYYCGAGEGRKDTTNKPATTTRGSTEFGASTASASVPPPSPPWRKTGKTRYATRPPRDPSVSRARASPSPFVHLTFFAPRSLPSPPPRSSLPPGERRVDRRRRERGCRPAPPHPRRQVAEGRAG